MRQSSGHAPLVWFTSLAIGGAGIIEVGSFHTPSDLGSRAIVLGVGSFTLAVGLLVSILHLGRKTRAPLAVRGFGALSSEVVLAVETLAAGLLLTVLYWQGHTNAWARSAGSVIPVMFLVSIGRVYWLQGQQTWRGVTPLLPLTTGLVCGAVFLAIASGSLLETSLPFWFVVIDVAVFALRWRVLASPAPAGTPRRIEVSRIHNLSATRLLVFDVIPLALLSVNWAIPALEGAAAALAVITVALGLAFDRWLFYALADQHTTEAEIARVEAIIERASRID